MASQPGSIAQSVLTFSSMIPAKLVAGRFKGRITPENLLYIRSYMSYFECDGCGATEYTEDNPFVEHRVPRLSDPSDLACIIAGCLSCLPGGKTPDEWTDYIESDEAMHNGHMFLT